MSSMPRVVLRPVQWSRGPSTQSTFVGELSTLISQALSTKEIRLPGSLLVKLANGWVLPGSRGTVSRITVTLSCQIEPVGDVRSDAVRAADGLMR